MKVSILIPVHNAAPFLADTLQSALAQSWHDKEIIVVDDGSVDNSLSIARSFEHHRSLHIFSQPNLGACRARNLAFEKSSGDYIQYLDADDLLSSDKIERQMALVEMFGKEFVYTSPWERFYSGQDINLISPTSKFLDRDWDDPLDWLCSSWEGKGMGMVSAWLCHRDLISRAGGWHERLLINQDGEFFSRVLLNSTGVKFCSRGMAYYRTGSNGSISRTKTRKSAESMLLSYRLYEENVSPNRKTGAVKRALTFNYSGFVYSFYGVYPELVEDAFKRGRALGFSRLPITGGKYFKALARVIGFESALRLRSMFRKMKSFTLTTK